MLERVRTVRLYGVLGARFGRVHHLAVNSAREACRALAILLPGFEAFMLESADKGMRFAVFSGTRNLSPRQLNDPPGRDDIRIAPVLQGAKKGGVFQTVLGVVLVVVGVATANYGLIAAGVGMMIGGVAQMLTPQPKGLAAQDSAANRASYAFNGPVTTSAQGGCVPLLYGGPLIVGGAVISAGIYAEDQQ